MHHPLARRARLRQAGFSLVELMIALTIGLLLMSGLAMIFVNSSDASRELQKTAQQIENGRYAIDIVTQDLRLAGFYGHLHDFSAISLPAAIPPDPCESGSAAELLKAFWFPAHGYRGTIDASGPASDAAADISATTCGTPLLTAANLKAGSDVLVVRRADTNALAAADVATSNVFYVQAGANGAEVQLGNGAAIGTNKADGDASTLKLTNGADPAPPAPIRRLRVHVYFVAPCSVGSAANGACTGAAGEDSIPTLKRLELSASASVTITPLVEGVDYFKVEYGVDTLPNVVSPETGRKGDATVDSYSATPADWTTVIAAKVYVLTRNTLPTTGFVDNKTYALGSASVPARNDAFKRHVYAATVQLVNAAGRREIP